MASPMPRTRGTALLVCLALLAGCSAPEKPPAAATPAGTPAPAAAGGIRLTTTMASPYDVDLSWQDPAAGFGGHIVEFATDPNGEYTILGFLPPETSTFRHPDLIPDTTMYYRVRAYYGPVSNTIEIALPDSLTDAAYAKAFEKEEDYAWAAPQTVPASGVLATESIRGANTAAGAPTDLKGALVPSTVSAFKMTWNDRAKDEEGYFLEMRAPRDTAYTVAAVTEPDVNSFGFALHPPERRATFRVRAFYYGKASNVETRKTGPEVSSSPAGK